MAQEKDVPEPRGYRPETVMTRAQLAKALNCSTDAIYASGLPVTYALGPQMPRYIWGDVVAALPKYTRT